MTSTRGQSHSEDAGLEEEQRWSRSGENLRIVNTSEKALEQKERELQSCIAQNYARIQGVEKELQGLQLQLKLTSGPKKSALEMLRRKIESQADRVIVARTGLAAATKAADAAAAKLAIEEAAKDELCKELNLLVQQSAHAQLDALEALTRRLEAINGGGAGSGSNGAAMGSANGQPLPLAATAELKEKIRDLAQSEAAGATAATMAVAADAAAEGPPVTSGPPADSVLPAGSANGGVSMASNAAEQSKDASEANRAQLAAEKQQQAAAARSRHVEVGRPSSAGRNATSSSARRADTRNNSRPLSSQPRNPNQPFRGFD